MTPPTSPPREKPHFSILITPATPPPPSPLFAMGRRRNAEENFPLLVLAANVFSIVWTFFCVHSSTDRRAWAYEFIHEEAAWYTLWYSCQTFAFLVSTTNVLLGVVTISSWRTEWREKVRQTQGWVRGGMVVLGLAACLLVVPLGFLPFRFTMVETRLGDENLWINWDI